jgi:hypothetical protein
MKKLKYPTFHSVLYNSEDQVAVRLLVEMHMCAAAKEKIVIEFNRIRETKIEQL